MPVRGAGDLRHCRKDLDTGAFEVGRVVGIEIGNSIAILVPAMFQQGEALIGSPESLEKNCPAQIQRL
jgi:hypothetical protein